MKEIIEVRVQGFCGGVAKAIETARSALKDGSPQPVSVLGSLVHNRFVNEALEKEGIRILEAGNRTRLELLDEIDKGTVIFTAHGVSNEVRRKAAAKHLHVIDASCPFVLSTQKLIEKKLHEGSTVLYCGKKGHPEAEGAVGLHSNVHLIETEDDLPAFLDGPVFVTNQTTMSVLDLQNLFEAIQTRFPQAEFCNEICNATRIRQQAVADLKDAAVDLLVVVGDPASNNTRKLADTGLKAGIPAVIQIESAAALDREEIRLAVRRAKRIAVTSGASTPSHLKDAVVKALRQCE